MVNIRLQANQNLVAPTRNRPAGLVPDQPMLRRILGTCATTNPDEEGFSGGCLAVAAKNSQVAARILILTNTRDRRSACQNFSTGEACSVALKSS